MLRYYERLGAAASKLIVGIPFYGQSFTLGSQDTGLGAGVRGRASRASGPSRGACWPSTRYAAKVTRRHVDYLHKHSTDDIYVLNHSSEGRLV